MTPILEVFGVKSGVSDDFKISVWSKVLVQYEKLNQCSE